MRILISPNAFKNSLTATEAAIAIQEGLKQSGFVCVTQCFPIGDGGDGTGELLINHKQGQLIKVSVSDPLGRKISSSFGLIEEGRTAVIEMANASGLRLLQLHELDPLHASSSGTGELIVSALERGSDKIILCIGGSATIDGGCGILKAIGFRFLDKNGGELTGMPESLERLDSIDFSGVDKRVESCKLIVLCDVENVLLGKRGAASTFGPQKGASPSVVNKLEACLTRFCEVVKKATGKNMASMRYGGAAGGIAAGLATLVNAELVNGIDYFLSVTDFDKALDATDLLITGEGSIDDQTLNGKGPFGVAKKAKEKNIPVIGLAGQIPREPDSSLNSLFDVLLPITNGPQELSEAILASRHNLIRTSITLGNLLKLDFAIGNSASKIN